ncbi:MAG: transposase, partial [Caldilineaceae bacterium]|nr:transposase [Caldilineaceae bacterium]
MQIGVSEVEAPSVSVNEIFRRYGASYAAQYVMTAEQRRVMQDIIDCRSGALGGHIEQCDACGEVQYRHHSCRNRHCPQCEGNARAEWLVARGEELLPAPYYHGVFTVDHIWNEVMRWNQQLCYDLLYRVVNELLKEYGQRYLGGEVGFIGVLHTWGQQLSYHVHLHCIILGGALRSDGVFVESDEQWLFPVVALAADFRQRFCAGVAALYAAGKLRLPAPWLDGDVFAAQQSASLDKAWEVYLKPPFGKPARVLEYLAGYVNRIAMSNRRIEEVSNNKVTFRYRDYRDYR